jgi:hypothetical protein
LRDYLFSRNISLILQKTHAVAFDLSKKNREKKTDYDGQTGAEERERRISGRAEKKRKRPTVR